MVLNIVLILICFFFYNDSWLFQMHGVMVLPPCFYPRLGVLELPWAMDGMPRLPSDWPSDWRVPIGVSHKENRGKL